jgi:DNA polymerase-3 subunit alpha
MPSTTEFVHLHVHSQYSLLDGMIKFGRMFKLAKSFNMPACAITDHGNMFGAMDYYFSAQEAGIKPIVGCEAYIAPRSRFEKKGKEDNAFHVVLLAMNNEGYYNLARLISLANLEGFYYSPRIDREILREHNAGIICLTACLKGEIPALLVRGKEDEAKKLAEEYYSIFGDRLFFELQDNGLEEQKVVNEGLARLSKHFDVPLVATNDCHYLLKEEARAHELLLCIQTGKTITDQNRLSFQSDEFYFKSPDDMAVQFSAYPDALKNTMRIAEMCDVRIERGNYQFPDFKVPEGMTTEDYLEDLCRKGFKEKLERIRSSYPAFTDDLMKQYTDRLDYELGVIKKTGFAGYFLIVTDFIHYAKTHDVPVGPGRGSAAGSLASYCLDITNIDPIKYDLMFERFLNPERISMPDIDVDFCYDNRERVIKYVSDKYGKDNVAQIVTFGTMKSRAAVRDVGRVLGMPYGEVDRLAKLIPGGAGNDEEIIKDVIKDDPTVREMYHNDNRVKDLLDNAMVLEGLARHSSTHAAGVVISNKPLLEHLPLHKGKEGEIITQYTMKAIEDIGLIKFDLLGLKTLTVIDHVIKLLAKQGIELDINSIPVDDPEVYKLLLAGNTSGVFQLESSGMTDILMRLGPTKLDQLIALVALYRPGPLNSGMTEEYIRRKNDPSLVSYDVPSLEPIMKETYGVMVYQEQVMQTAVTLGGFSLKDADGLRKAMGKKIKEKILHYRSQFIEGCVKNNVSEKLAGQIYDAIEEFGKYGFNKAHSAAYAYIAYQTAYLKTHYLVPFMAALVSNDVNDTDKVIRYLGECRASGVRVLPPHVNESGKEFTVVDDRSIRFGLSGIKGLGNAAIENIIEERAKSGPFASFEDFLDRCDSRKVNKKVVECLAKAGCFDDLGLNRSQIMHLVQEKWETIQKQKPKEKEMAMVDMFAGLDLSNSVKKKLEVPDVATNPHDLSRWEKEAFGFYFTEHPLNTYGNYIRRLTPFDTENIRKADTETQAMLVGVVNGIKEIMTKKGKMAFVQLEDLSGSVETVFFSDAYAKHASTIQAGRPVVVTGIVDRQEDGPTKLKVSDVAFLADMTVDMKKSVVIRIDIDRFRKDKLRDLRGAVESSRASRTSCWNSSGRTTGREWNSARNGSSILQRYRQSSRRTSGTRASRCGWTR